MLSTLDSSGSLYILKIKESAGSFARLVVDKLAHIKELPLVIFDCADHDVSELEQATAMSFLGSYSLYYLLNFDLLADKKRAQFASFLKKYCGSHVLVVFVSAELKIDGALYEEISDTLSLPHVLKLVDRFEDDSTVSVRRRAFYSALQPHVVFTPEIFGRLWCYASLVGSRVDSFKTSLLPHLVVADFSLFEVAAAFFAKDIQKFMKLYGALAGEFQPPFWVTFFSEQLYRAYWYLYFKEQQKLIDAQKIGYRLPYSFLQKDWRLHKRADLHKLNKAIYLFDTQFKQGGTPLALDCILTSYLINT